MGTLEIRPEQLQVLQDDVDRRFVARYRALVRGRLGKAGTELSDSDLEQRMRAALARARSYDLSIDCDVIAFVMLTLRVGPRFDEHDPFRRVLADGGESPSQRLDAMFNQADPEDWVRAAAIGSAGDR